MVQGWVAEGSDFSPSSTFWEQAPSSNINSASKVEKNKGKPPKGLKFFFQCIAQAMKSTEVIDSGASGHFMRQVDGGIPTGKKSHKVVGMTNGQTVRATQQVLLPLDQLNKRAREGDKLPGLRYSSLFSVPILADNGYTTIFKSCDKGVEVYKSTQVEIIPKSKPLVGG